MLFFVVCQPALCQMVVIPNGIMTNSIKPNGEETSNLFGTLSELLLRFLNGFLPGIHLKMFLELLLRLFCTIQLDYLLELDEKFPKKQFLIPGISPSEEFLLRFLQYFLLGLAHMVPFIISSGVVSRVPGIGFH